MASDSSIWLVVLSFSMLIGSFLAGIVPLGFHLSETRLHVATTFGAGLLVGTALGIIVPEGVETLYAAYQEPGEAAAGPAASESAAAERRAEQRAAAALGGGGEPGGGGGGGGGGVLGFSPRSAPASGGGNARGDEGDVDVDAPPPVDFRSDARPPAPDPQGRRRRQQDRRPVAGGGEGGGGGVHHHDRHDSPHWLVGGALTAGFAFMLVVERFGHAHGRRSPPPGAARHQVDLADFTAIPMADFADEGGAMLLPARPASQQSGGRAAATIGMIIHAAADGVALGAASSAKESNLQAIVFFAVMLH
ncbi:MAG: hypothetical protein BJ554DRAFT_1012, partial [Olpidium bornovanus]